MSIDVSRICQTLDLIFVSVSMDQDGIADCSVCIRALRCMGLGSTPAVAGISMRDLKLVCCVSRLCGGI